MSMSTEQEQMIVFEEVDGVGVALKRVGTNFVLTISGSKEYYIEFDGFSEQAKLRIVNLP